MPKTLSELGTIALVQPACKRGFQIKCQKLFAYFLGKEESRYKCINKILKYCFQLSIFSHFHSILTSVFISAKQTNDILIVIL